MILGAGFTGSRVAELLRATSRRVTAVHRTDIDFTQPDSSAQLRNLLTPGCVVLHSLPSLPLGADYGFLPELAGFARRIVYLSTTGVYGAAEYVDENTVPAPSTPRELARLASEKAVLAGPWGALILRPAAIYGPGRGAHVAIREGRYRLLGDGSKFVSRIHVDDLAAVAEAALRSDLTGAYPVADEYPCTSREIAEYCARLLGVPMPESAESRDIPETRRANRRVNGSAILRALELSLRYPSYREGIPASIAQFEDAISKGSERSSKFDRAR